MIKLKNGYAIEEEEYGTVKRWKFTAPNEYKDRYFNVYEDALRYYITVHTQEELEHSLGSWFYHYEETPDIQIRMPLKQEQYFNDCINFGFTDYFLAHEYRHYMKHRIADMYHRLTSWKNMYRDKYSFEVDELRELCLVVMDIIKLYEREMKEYIAMVEKEYSWSPDTPWQEVTEVEPKPQPKPLPPTADNFVMGVPITEEEVKDEE